MNQDQKIMLGVGLVILFAVSMTMYNSYVELQETTQRTSLHYGFYHRYPFILIESLVFGVWLGFFGVVLWMLRGEDGREEVKRRV